MRPTSGKRAKFDGEKARSRRRVLKRKASLLHLQKLREAQGKFFVFRRWEAEIEANTWESPSSDEDIAKKHVFLPFCGLLAGWRFW
jgi:arginyl-tRNA--protein-N-Asp/Glu arginylyltransferase